MSLYQWLLFFHVTGAFFLIGGIVVAGILNLAALVKDRPPSEVAALYRLIRFAVPLIGVGLVLTLAISYGSGLMAFAVLGLMIWKPGV